MKRILSTLLALLPGAAIGGLAYWLYSSRPEPVILAKADPAPEAAGLNPTAKTQAPLINDEQLQFEEERLANLREGLAELNEESLGGDASAPNETMPPPADPTEAGAPQVNTPPSNPPANDGAALPSVVDARIQMLEAEIKSLSNPKAAIEAQLQQLDTQILEVQGRLHTLGGTAGGSPDPQAATLQAQLEALKSTREQLESERQSTGDGELESALAQEVGGVTIDPAAERLSDLRGELEYWQARKAEGDTPALKARRKEQLERLIAAQEAKLENLRKAAAPKVPENTPPFESITQ